MHITSDSTNQSLQPFIWVDCGPLGTPTVALIDTGADVNTISYALWLEMGKPPLVQQELNLVGMAQEKVHMIGKCNLPIYVCGHKCSDTFFVFPKNVSSTQLILGQPWQRAFQCTIKWQKDAVKLMVKKQKILIPFTTLEDDHVNSTPAISISNKGKEIVDPKQTPSKAPTIKNTIKTEDHTRRNSQRAPGVNSCQKWVPKTVVAAQAKAQQIWLPKIVTKQPKQPPKPTPQTPRQPPKQIKSTWRWVPKKLLQAQAHNSLKWIPKVNQRSRGVNQAQPLHKPHQNIKEVKQQWQPINLKAHRYDSLPLVRMSAQPSTSDAHGSHCSMTKLSCTASSSNAFKRIFFQCIQA